MRRRRASWLLLPLAWATACGGRYQSLGDDDEPGGGATGQGGSSAGASHGGTGSGGKLSGGGKGGTISVGTGGATTMGGAPIFGGSGTAGGCTCPPIACAPGYIAVPDPTGCCFHCQQDVEGCEQAHVEYKRLRQDLLEKYRSSGCMTDADCAVYYEKNACEANGCPVILPGNTIMSFASNLENFAQTSCTGCFTEPLHPCEPVPPGLCRMGRCQ